MSTLRLLKSPHDEPPAATSLPGNASYAQERFWAHPSSARLITSQFDQRKGDAAPMPVVDVPVDIASNSSDQRICHGADGDDQCPQWLKGDDGTRRIFCFRWSGCTFIRGCHGPGSPDVDFLSMQTFVHGSAGGGLTSPTG
jgi:hypothetical protein